MNWPVGFYATIPLPFIPHHALSSSQLEGDLRSLTRLLDVLVLVIFTAHHHHMVSRCRCGKVRDGLVISSCSSMWLRYVARVEGGGQEPFPNVHDDAVNKTEDWCPQIKMKVH